MGSILPELSLDVRPSFVPKPIGDFLGELTTIGSISEKIYKIDDFVGRLEEEMRKIDAFKRELPLCVLITSDAILALKEELKKCRKRNAESRLEEFIPLKKNCVDGEKIKGKKENDRKDKMNWMSSVQLWSSNHSKDSTSDFDRKQELVPNFIKGTWDPYGSCESRNDSGVFSPIAVERGLPAAGFSLLSPTSYFPDFSPTANGSKVISSSTPDSQSNLRVVPQQQNGRKQRRCWSPELHRLFVYALEKLGGSQVATPKQIRDLMQVDGLTNDEVKSHLQKYRLHTRRIPQDRANPSNTDLEELWKRRDQSGESSKQSSTNTQSGSPTGPLQLSRNGRILEGDDDEEGSESYECRNQNRDSGNRDNV